MLACLDVHLIKDMNAWLPQTSCLSINFSDILCSLPLLLSRPYIVGLVLTLPEIHDLLCVHLRWCVPGLPTKCGSLVFLLSLVPEKDGGGNRGLVRTQTHTHSHTHTAARLIRTGSLPKSRTSRSNSCRQDPPDAIAAAPPHTTRT